MSDVEPSLGDIRSDVVGRIDREVDTYRPPATRWDRVRLFVSYILLSLLAALGIALAAAVFARWPAGVKFGVALVCLLLILGSALFLALTLVLKVGNDGCARNRGVGVCVRVFFYGRVVTVLSLWQID